MLARDYIELPDKLRVCSLGKDNFGKEVILLLFRSNTFKDLRVLVASLAMLDIEFFPRLSSLRFGRLRSGIFYILFYSNPKHSTVSICD